jgi:hypothetical protein
MAKPPTPPPKRHGSTLHVDLPVVGESTLRERAELCLRALARSEGINGCDGGGPDEPCMFPACLVLGCPGDDDAT